MPKQKDLKRVVRTRMQKTGESYTAARLRILDKKKEPPRPEPEYATLAGMSDDSVRAKTGRSWREWTVALDALDAAEKPHPQIAKMVRGEFGLGSWWAQTVTVGYERIRGLREIGQRREGTYEVSKSRTFRTPVGELYRTFRDPRRRARWLPDVKLTLRKATEDKSLRITWPDGTFVEVGFYPKGDSKSQVTIQHTKLPSREVAEHVKKYWDGRLDALGAMLERKASGRS